MKLISHIKLLALSLIAAIGLAGLQTLPASADGHSTIAAHGTFEGRSDHVTKGGVSIIKTASGYIAVLESDFSLDGAPAPTLGFGNKGKFDKATEFTKLASKDGLQSYALPAGIDPSKYDEFVVWCADFSVPLGVAKLK